MKTTAAVVLFAFAPVVSAFHGANFPPPGGGTWGGPGDTVPPGGGPPSGPGPAAPSGPAPGAPTGPGPGTPSSPTGPMPGSVPTGARNPAGGIPTGGAAGLEPTSWEIWWRYNRDAFLDLKARVDTMAPATLGDTQQTVDAPVARGIEAALAALEREKQRDLISGLLVGIARSCDGAAHERASEIATKLEPFLGDPDQEVGETAAAALGILRHHSGVADLVALLHDGEDGRKLARGRVSSRTRAFAAYGLGLAAARSEREELRAFAAHHLERALEASRGAASADVAAACVIALGLVPMPEDEVAGPIRASPREAATDLPPRTRGAQAALLLGILQDQQRPVVVRAHVPDALARLGLGADAELRNEIARELCNVLERQTREDTGVVRGAVLALGRLADCDADASDLKMRIALKRALDAADGQARLFALVSLAQVAGRPGDSEDPGAVQSEIQQLLLEHLVRGKSRERSWSAISLGILEKGRKACGRQPSPAVRAALRRELAGASAPDQIGAIAIGIGLCQDLAATRELLAKLEDTRDPVGRGHIATALGLLAAPEAVKPLRAILLKSRFQPELLRETAIALALLGDVDLESALLDELRQAKSLSSQAGLARAIGFAGTLATVDPLTKMLADGSLTAGARAFSAVALGMVCDRERLPWNAFLSFGVNYPSSPATLTDGAAGILDIL